MASQLSACYATELLSGTKMLPFLGQAFSLWQGKAAMRAEFIAPLAREKFDVMSRIRLWAKTSAADIFCPKQSGESILEAMPKMFGG